VRPRQCDLIRHAVAKREALFVELENLRDAILRKPADIVTLRQGVDTLGVADAVLAASRDRTAITLSTYDLASVTRRMLNSSMALGACGDPRCDRRGAGQDRPAASGPDSRERFRVHGADSTPRWHAWSRRPGRPFPASPGSMSGSARSSPLACLRHDRNHGCGVEQ